MFQDIFICSLKTTRLLRGAGLWGRAVWRSLRRSGESGRVGGQLAQSTVAATIFMSRR